MDEPPSVIPRSTATGRRGGPTTDMLRPGHHSSRTAWRTVPDGGESEPRSSTITEAPARASSRATVAPPGPDPTTATSYTPTSVRALPRSADILAVPGPA